MTDISLCERCAVVTGAAGGIGAATAEALARAGASLVLVDADGDGLRATQQRLLDAEISGDEVVTIEASVTDPASVQSYMERAMERFGSVEVVFNNAGVIGDLNETAGYSEAAFDRVMDVNVKGVWLNLKYGISSIRSGGRGGSIINTASGFGLVGSPGSCAYVASKHAVIGLTRTAALEVASEGIRVNAVCPGPVDTPMMQRLGSEPTDDGRTVKDVVLENLPLERYARSEEIADATAFLASDASSYVTGATLAIDGGYTAR